MKEEYPSYKKGSTEEMYEELKGKEKKEVDNFFNFCNTTCSKKRLKKYKRILMQAKDIMEKSLIELEEQDIINFLAVVNNSDRSDWTKNDIKKCFKRFVKWYYDDMNLLTNEKLKQAFKGVSSKRARNKEKINPNTLLTEKELEKLIRAAKSLKWKAIISLLYEAALRPCELVKLKWKDIKFNDQKGIARIHIYSPKTGETRNIPIQDSIVHLKRWKEEYQYPNRKKRDYVFPGQRKREKHISSASLNKIIKTKGKQAGIDKKVYPYILRHTRLTELHKKLPEKIAAKFGGHSIETSELYSNLDDDDIEESMLNRVYQTKEINDERKHELEKEIEKLKNQQEEIAKKVQGELKDTQKIFKILKENLGEDEKKKLINLEGLDV